MPAKRLHPLDRHPPPSPCPLTTDPRAPLSINHPLVLVAEATALILAMVHTGPLAVAVATIVVLLHHAIPTIRALRPMGRPQAPAAHHHPHSTTAHPHTITAAQNPTDPPSAATTAAPRPTPAPNVSTTRPPLPSLNPHQAGKSTPQASIPELRNVYRKSRNRSGNCWMRLMRSKRVSGRR